MSHTAPLPVFLPARGAFGAECTYPLQSSCRMHDHGLDGLLGMFASWNTCRLLEKPIPAAESNTLVEVTRVIHPRSAWHEGLSFGWLPNRTGHVHARPYGCWFYRAPGSGIWLNVTRTKIFTTRETLHREWDWPRSKSTEGSSGDFQICSKAISRGYSTVQIMGRQDKGGHSVGIPELILCAGPCIQEESTSACPGVPLQQSDGSKCSCDPRWPLLRCKNQVEDEQTVNPCPSEVMRPAKGDASKRKSEDPAERPCPSSSAALLASLQPHESQLPVLPHCTTLAVPALDDGPQCVYPNSDGTWSRTRSTDHLVRQENLKEYPPLATQLRSLGVQTIIDAGANDGLSTRLFALGIGALDAGSKARVIALEPSLSNYAMLKVNTQGIPSVTALRAALWNSSSRMTVQGSGTLSWSLTVKPETAAGGMDASNAHAVSPVATNEGLPGVSLPQLLDALCWERLDFLKMDIEGAERFVLVPGSSSWLRRVKYFYMEAHAYARSDTGESAVATSLQALARAGMTVVTNPNLTRATWMPSQPKVREYVFLACAPDVPSSSCLALCESWRAGTGLGCQTVMRYHSLRPKV